MKSKVRQMDFNGQPINIGIDVHKKSWQVTFSTLHTVQKTITFEKPFVKPLVQYLERTFPGGDYRAVYEAGFSGYWAQRALEAVGITTLVVHPADIPTTDKEKQFKNDKRDSRKLSLALRSGELEGIFIPSVQALEDRSLVRERWNISRSEKRVKNQIKSQLLFYGIDIPTDFADRYWSRRFITWLERVSKRRSDVALRFKIDRLLALRQIALAMTHQLRELSRRAPYDQLYPLLHSVPGVGLLNGLLLLTELIDIRRFKSSDALHSYAGMIPRIYSSGDRERTGGMIKRGNKRIRTALIESSWVAIRYDSELLFRYETYRQRMNAQKAIVRIARILLQRIRQVWLKKEPYRMLEG